MTSKLTKDKVVTERRYNYYRVCDTCKGMTFCYPMTIWKGKKKVRGVQCMDCMDEDAHMIRKKGSTKEWVNLGVRMTRFEVERLIRNLPDNGKEG